MNVSEFLQQTAEEVMVRKVTTLRPHDTLSDAAYKFLHARISGAPVVDTDGKCVGVVSVSDIVAAPEKLADQRAEAVDVFFRQSDFCFPTIAYENELIRFRDKSIAGADGQVRDVMVKDVVSVTVDADLQEVLEDFIEARIHRVIVLDRDDKLAGLVTMADVLGALLRAMDQPTIITP